MNLGSSPQPELARLLSQAATSDRVAFAALYKHTHAKLYGIVAAILFRRSDLVGDVLQETYLSIWKKAGDFDPAKGSPISWMAAIARNQALSEVRRVKPAALEDMPAFDPPAQEFDPLDPVGSHERSERLRVLIDCLSKLDARNRDIIMLAYYRGASREALSERFGAPIPTIKTRLRRALMQLKLCLGPPELISASIGRGHRRIPSSVNHKAFSRVPLRK